MDRRGFLQSFMIGVSTLAVDPERLLWVPGAKRIFIPPDYPTSITLEQWARHWEANPQLHRIIDLLSETNEFLADLPYLERILADRANPDNVALIRWNADGTVAI